MKQMYKILLNTCDCKLPLLASVVHHKTHRAAQRSVCWIDRYLHQFAAAIIRSISVLSIILNTHGKLSTAAQKQKMKSTSTLLGHCHEPFSPGRGDQKGSPSIQ